MVMNAKVLGVMLCGAALLPSILPAAGHTGHQKAPNGIVIPADFRDWQTIAVSHREDNKTLRTILGNDVAVKAAREGNTNPWPKGSILAKLVWKDSKDPHWAAATVPGRFVHAEFMFKDADKYRDTGGWGYARWLGEKLEPYGKDAGFAQECVGCHTPVKSRDYVFTTPAVIPAAPTR